MHEQQIKVLLLSANPRYHAEGDRLRTDREFTDIDTNIYEAANGRSFNVAFGLAARVMSVQKALRRHRPHIVHFGGHGAYERGIVFENEQGGSDVADEVALSRLFNVLRGHVRIIFLNACNTQPLAAKLLGISDYTIGTDCAIPDKDAIAFSASFYQALASGDSVRQAFETATVPLRVSSRLDDKVRLNVRRGVNADEPFVEQVARRFGWAGRPRRLPEPEKREPASTKSQKRGTHARLIEQAKQRLEKTRRGQK